MTGCHEAVKVPVMVKPFRALLCSLSILAGGGGLHGAAASAGVSLDDHTGLYARFLDGHFAASEGNAGRAAADWLTAVALDPANRGLRQQAFTQSLLANRPEAIGLAAELSGDPVAQMLLGDAAAQAGHWREAERRFATIESAGMMQLLRPVLAAWAKQGAGETDAALAMLQPLTASRQLPGLYALHAALIADQAGRTATAGQFFASAQTGNSVPPLRLAQLIAGFEERQHNEQAALRVLDEVGQQVPLLRLALPELAMHLRDVPVANAVDGLAEAYVGFAAAVHQDGDERFAEILLRLALGLRPDFTAARLLAAEVLDAQHDLTGAIGMLAAVPESDPLSPVARAREAELAAREAQPAQAVRELEALARAFPDSPLPDSEIGDVLRADNDFAGAARAYSQALALTGTPGAADWPLFYDRGIAFAQAGNWPQAEADFAEALRLEPNQPLVLNYLGYTWADRGEHLAKAREMLETAARLLPEDGAVIDSLGWVVLRQGDAADAVSLLEHAAELDPSDATINGHLGDAYWAVGRKVEAAYQWRLALILNPAPADAAKLEAKLHETTAAVDTVPTRMP
jgi:tetratricopeptide (TPR) repeat protein